MPIQFLNALIRFIKALDTHRVGASYLLKLLIVGCATVVLLGVLGIHPA